MMNGTEIIRKILADAKEELRHVRDMEALRKYQWKVYGAAQALVMAGLITEEQKRVYSRIIREYGCRIREKAEWD